MVNKTQCQTPSQFFRINLKNKSSQFIENLQALSIPRIFLYLEPADPTMVWENFQKVFKLLEHAFASHKIESKQHFFKNLFPLNRDRERTMPCLNKYSNKKESIQNGGYNSNDYILITKQQSSFFNPFQSSAAINVVKLT